MYKRQGLILWKPKGALIRRSLQDFITQELDTLGYSQVYTPNIGKLDLYRTSGHFPYCLLYTAHTAPLRWLLRV